VLELACLRLLRAGPSQQQGHRRQLLDCCRAAPDVDNSTLRSTYAPTLNVHNYSTCSAQHGIKD
jgi:hypothetical protein